MSAAPYNPSAPDAPRPFRAAWDRFVAANARRGFLWCPVWFGAGMAVYFTLAAEPDIRWIAVFAALAGCAALVARRYGAAVLGFVLAAVFLVAAGLGTASLRTAQVGTYLLGETAGPLMVEGRVRNVAMRDEKRTSAVLGDVWMEHTKAAQTPHTIRLTGYHIPHDTPPGTKVRVLAKLMPPSSPVVPGGYDFRLKAYFDGIGATGYTLGAFQVLAPPAEDSSVPHLFDRLRAAINRRIETAQGAGGAAVSKALVTGDRAAIGKDAMQNIRAAGLAHLLSISGLHISLFAGGVFFALRFLMALWPRIALHYPIKKFAAVAGIVAALFYMGLAGATVPTQRATIMAVIVFAAVLLDRKAISLRLVAISALAVLAWRPEAVLNPGFQMSFAAVTALVAFYEWFSRRPREDGTGRGGLLRIGLGYVAGIVLTSLVAGTATMIYAVYHFGNINPYAVAGNIVALPVMSAVVMPCAILGLLTFPFESVSGFFFQIMGIGVEGILAAAARIAAWPHAVYRPPVMPAAAMVMLSFGFLSLCLLGNGRIKALATAFCGMAAVAIWCLSPRLVIVVHDVPVAVSWRMPGGTMHHIPRAPSRFVRDMTERSLTPLPLPLPQEGAVSGQCDAFGCQWDVAGTNVLYLTDPVALAQECVMRKAAYIFVRHPVGAAQKEACQTAGGMVYDFDDLRRHGAHGLFLSPLDGRVSIAISAPESNRPWNKNQ